MSSLCIAYAIFLMLVLTPRSTSADVKNKIDEQTVSPDVITSFLRVPWINLNSSWKDAVATHCRNDVEMLFKSADAGEMWALQMLDAASRIPPGILMGNIYDLGMYDECVGVKGHHNPANIQGQHCMVSLAFPTKFVSRSDAAKILLIQKISSYNPSADLDFGLSLSVCLPSSCSVEDIKGIVDASIKSTSNLVKLETKVAQVTCSRVDPADDLSAGSFIAILIFFVVIGGLLLLSTVCDYVVRSRSADAPRVLQTFAKFSLYTNAAKLLSTEITPGTMPAVNGIRFLSTCLVLIVHRIVSIIFRPTVNVSEFLKYRQSALTSLFFIILYAVDTFFIITGFLTTYLFLKRMRSGVKFNLPVFYLHRYLRLVPCIAVLILFNIFIVPYLGSGPLWENRLKNTVDYCRKNWWTNLLFIHNLVNRNEMCLPHTWTSAVEMQLYLICPIILYPLFHRPRIGLIILGVFLGASLITPVVQIFVYNYSFVIDLSKSQATILDQLFSTYTTTYNRALPYFVGIFLGYDVVNNKRRVTKVQAVFNWTLVCVVVLLCFWTGYHIQPNAIVYDAVWEAVYTSIGRLGWSLAMAWIIYACTQGYGGPVTRLLSLPIFLPLSRLSYGIYLVSLVIQVGLQSMERTADFHNPIAILYQIWGDLVTSIAVAFVLNVCIEAPVILLEKLITAERPPTIVKRASTRKKRLAAVVRDYFDLTRERSSSGSIGDTKMPPLDFWKTTSHLLNNSSKGRTRTPEEWEKTWEEWKSDRLDNDCHRKTDPADTQNPTLEEELLIFLMAVTSVQTSIPARTFRKL